MRRVTGAEPAGIILALDNDRHAIVQRGDNMVGIGGDDREALHPLADGGIFPAFPQTGEAIGLAAGERDSEWLLVFWVQLLPLIKCVRGHQAAATLKRFTEGRGGRYGLGLGIDGGVGDARVLRPVRNQAPTHEDDLAHTWVAIQAYHGLEGLWGYVIAGAPFQRFVIVRTEPRSDLSPG